MLNDGIITKEEALANADSPSNLHWLISNAGQEPTDTAGKTAEKNTSDRTMTGADDDLSSIKLNLDMV